jgi:predicted ribosome quality control (RQC) complex YloA/Tae2 family protein
MFLRKHVRGLTLLAAEQINFDRILAFHFGHTQVERVLIVELFAEGNVILCDGGEAILGLLKREEFSSRSLEPKTRYLPPPTRLSPKIPWEEFERLDIGEEKDLARLFNFGGTYAREIVLRAGGLEKRRLFEALNSFVKNPCIVSGEGPFPYEMRVHEGRTKTFFSTFFEAADEFYGKQSAQTYAQAGAKEKEKKVSETERIIASQVAALEEYERKREESQKKGDTLYEHYDLVSRVLESLKGRRTLDEVRGEMGEGGASIATFDTKRGVVTFDFGAKVACEVKLSLHENANAYYERAKKMARKIRGAQAALLTTRKREEQEAATPAREAWVKTMRHREWFEKFRWCYTSGGRMMLGGRDARNNEMLVKKYMEPADIYLHADVHGAAQVVLKDGQKATEREILEAAAFACAYSSAWGRAADAYWVTPDQVTKTPPSGEYLTAGAFFIKGKKNILKGVSSRVGIGILEDKVMFGPLEPVLQRCLPCVEIEPSEEKKEILAKALARALGHEDIDEIVRALPGGGRIKS